MNNTFFTRRQNCPACKAKDNKTIYSCCYLASPIKDFLKSYYGHLEKFRLEYLEKATFILNECSSCGLVFQEQIPDNLLLEKLYEEELDIEAAVNQFPQYDNLDYYAGLAKEIMMSIEFLGKRPSQLKFLDFGMGWGKWCRMAKGFGCEAFGTEISQARIDYAKSQGIQVISWDNLPRYKFDLINLEQVLEHLAEPLDILCYLKQSLKSDGLIKICVPNGSGIKKRLKTCDWMAPKNTRNSLNPVHPLEHINCFNYNSLIKMAHIAGLKRVKIPIKIQYIYGTNWKPYKRLARNIVGPLYRNMLKNATYLFFQHNMIKN
ncbi:MAG: class I SAM-dependent methyltransferase [bacterium]